MIVFLKAVGWQLAKHQTAAWVGLFILQVTFLPVLVMNYVVFLSSLMVSEIRQYAVRLYYPGNSQQDYQYYMYKWSIQIILMYFFLGLELPCPFVIVPIATATRNRLITQNLKFVSRSRSW
jgi:hypothetical protein